MAGRRAGRGAPPFRFPGVTRALPSAPGSHAVRVATSSVEDPRGTPGPADSPFSVPGRVDLRGWLTAKGESGRIIGFHRRLLLTGEELSALPPRSKGNSGQFA